MTPPAWPTPGLLSELLDPAALGAQLVDAGLPALQAQPTYVRLKPEASVLVAYEATVEGQAAPLRGYVRTFADPERAAGLAAAWRRKRPLPCGAGPALATAAGRDSVLFALPNDDLLPALRVVLRPDKLKRALTPLLVGDGGGRVAGTGASVIPVRYKPERRLVAAASFSVVAPDRSRNMAALHLRVVPGGARRLAALGRHLATTAAAPLLAPSLGTLLDGRVHVEATVDGRPAVDAPGDGLRADLLDEAVARLHAAPLPEWLAAPPARPDVRVTEALDAVGVFAPDLCPLADEVAALLGDALRRVPPPGRPTLLHGDLHLDQVLVAPDGLRLVDLERARPGDPLEDLGALVSSARALAAGSGRDDLARLADDLQAAALRRHGRPSALAAHTAVGLVERALVAVRTVVAGATAAELALGAAIELLAPASRGRPAAGPGPPPPPPLVARPEGWERFHPRPTGRWPGVAGGRPGRYDPERGTFEAVDPAHDPALPALARWLPRGELVAYRPGQRAVVRVATDRGCRYAKVLPRRKADRLVDRLAALDAAVAGGARLPRLAPLLDRPEDDVLLFGALGGPSLHDVLKGQGSIAPGAALTAVAGVLALLAQVDITSLGLPVADPVSPGLWLRVAADRSGLPVAPYEAALEALPPPPPQAAAVLVHGDLHDKNLILGPDGPGLLDLDSVALGPVGLDAGNLAAHRILRALQQGADAATGTAAARRLLSEAGPGVGGAQAEAETARTLFRLACLYAFRRRWRPLVPALLTESTRWSSRVMPRWNGA